jgi:alpha-L-arabinofuranosidase
MLRYGRAGTRVFLVVAMALAGTIGVGLAQRGPQAPPPPRTTPDTIRAVIDVSRTGEPINPLMYGRFIENLGNWFETGLWAEMIGDRKFFYPINNNPGQTPRNSRSNNYGRWAPIGSENQVVMDRARAYSGVHAPKVLLDASTPHGIRQPKLGLRSSLAYTGRIVLAGDPGAKVSVTLVWGTGAQDRQTAAIPQLSSEYRTYPLRFSPKGDTRDGSIEITGVGSGSFWIAAVSLMRSDNLEGWNPEMIAIMKEMRPTLLRWGGNFSANYDWRNGIGDPDRRPIRYDYAWSAIEPNDVGTFEVLTLNRLIGSEPNIGVNSALGDAYSAAQWVEYVNGAASTPMGKLRAEHGHPAPFNVKWWGIGNEMYGEWQIGHMYIGHYVIKHNFFAEAMRKVDPSIILVASGASRYQQSADSRSNYRLPLVVKPPFPLESSQDWTGWLLRNSWENMDYISEHIYGSQSETSFDLATQHWVNNPAILEDRLRQVPNRIQGVAEDWQEYRRRMPFLKDTKIRMVLDEWDAGGSEVFRMLWAGLGLNELFRHTDVYSMSAYTCTACAANYNNFDKPVLRAEGVVFVPIANRMGTIPVLGIEGNSPQPELNGTVGVDKPQVSSGSPTYPLDVMAALSKDRKTLTVSVVNPSERGKPLVLEVQGASATSKGKKWTVAAPSLEARNIAGKEQLIRVVESEVGAPNSAATVAPLSINLYEWQLQ